MKKNILWILAAALCLTLALPGHASEGYPVVTITASPAAVDAFNTFSGANNLNLASATVNEILDEVMAGSFGAEAKDLAAANKLAPALEKLTAITSLDMVNYAAEKSLPKAQVRNAYYRALANVLRAEIMVNPASETRYQNIQIILDLFLNGDAADEVISETRKVIRQSMTPQHAATIAADYNLPAGFVEFVIMDDDWDNDDWTDDTSWIANGGYAGTDDYIATDDYLGTDAYGATDDYVASIDYNDSVIVTSSGKTYVSTDDYSTTTSSKPAATSSKPAATPRPSRNTPDTPDNTPDYNTPDYNTPDRNTPDSPDYDNSH